MSTDEPLGLRIVFEVRLIVGALAGCAEYKPGIGLWLGFALTQHVGWIGQVLQLLVNKPYLSIILYHGNAIVNS